jgi:hypothetical protein
MSTAFGAKVKTIGTSGAGLKILHDIGDSLERG